MPLKCTRRLAPFGLSRLYCRSREHSVPFATPLSLWLPEASAPPSQRLEHYKPAKAN
ncbi:hypothetical protein TrVGV298_009297 [Trichoderma virens]|nr:hypothetical protein TrVGV298_009297 [Trichoderma virens]